jgi:hypothetical protein
VELVKVKNAFHSLTKKHGSSIRCGGGGGGDLLGGSKTACSECRLRTQGNWKGGFKHWLQGQKGIVPNRTIY